MTKNNKDVKALQLKMDNVTRTQSIFNSNQVQKIFNSTQDRYKYKRPAKGGGEWTYVRSSYVRRVLDSIFGFNWDFVVETSLSEAFDVAIKTRMCVVKGILKGRVKIDGHWVEITKTQWGRAEVKLRKDTKDPLDFGNDMKAATSDALKKCASMLGIAADVYDPEEFMEIIIEGSEEASERRKNQRKMIDDVKKSIAEEGDKVGGENGTK